MHLEVCPQWWKAGQHWASQLPSLWTIESEQFPNISLLVHTYSLSSRTPSPHQIGLFSQSSFLKVKGDFIFKKKKNKLHFTVDVKFALKNERYVSIFPSLKKNITFLFLKCTCIHLLKNSFLHYHNDFSSCVQELRELVVNVNVINCTTMLLIWQVKTIYISHHCGRTSQFHYQKKLGGNLIPIWLSFLVHVCVLPK